MPWTSCLWRQCRGALALTKAVPLSNSYSSCISSQDMNSRSSHHCQSDRMGLQGWISPQQTVGLPQITSKPCRLKTQRQCKGKTQRHDNSPGSAKAQQSTKLTHCSLSMHLCSVIAHSLLQSYMCCMLTGSTSASALAEASTKSACRIQRPAAMPAKLFTDRTKEGSTT